MNIYEIVFLISLGGAIAILAYKLYNIIKIGITTEKDRDFKVMAVFNALMTFAGYFLFWFFLLLVLLNEPGNFYASLFTLASYGIIMAILLTFIELIMGLGKITNNFRTKYESRY